MAYYRRSYESSDSFYDSEEEEDDVWVGHYCSSHRLLLVGEADFSFALSLAKAFGHGYNMVATTLDNYAEVQEKYLQWDNTELLQEMGCEVYYGVDATEMSDYEIFKNEGFDRIVFNFPHAGFHASERSEFQIRLHRELLDGFFKNASQMLDEFGEIHVTHRTDYPYTRWNLVSIAESNGLSLTEYVEFCKGDYDGYCNKRGDGDDCDESFPAQPSATFKFMLSSDC